MKNPSPQSHMKNQTEVYQLPLQPERKENIKKPSVSLCIYPCPQDSLGCTYTSLADSGHFGLKDRKNSRI